MMKRVLSVILAVIFLQAFFVQSAMANDKKEKAKDHKAWYFAASPVYYLSVHMTIHEGSHALVGAINPNYQVSNFKPWPHYNADRSFFFLSSVYIVCSSKEACADKTGSGVISLAPYITDTVLFTTSDLLLATNMVKPTSIAGRVLYFAGMVVPWWDLSYNAIWATKLSDANHIAESFEIPRWSVMAMGAGVSAVGLWRLWGGYERAFFAGSKRPVNEPNLVIAPMRNSGTAGLSASMRF